MKWKRQSYINQNQLKKRELAMRMIYEQNNEVILYYVN